MLNHYTTKMTGPLKTWIIHLSFSCFYMVIQGVYYLLYCQNPYSHIKCIFTKIQSNIAIWQYIAIYLNTICNMTFTHIVSSLLVATTYKHSGELEHTILDQFWWPKPVLSCQFWSTFRKYKI